MNTKKIKNFNSNYCATEGDANIDQIDNNNNRKIQKFNNPLKPTKLINMIPSQLAPISDDQSIVIDGKSEAVYFYLWRIKNGAWRIIEAEPIVKLIKNAGYDGFMVTERGSDNVAIFSEDFIQNFKKL